MNRGVFSLAVIVAALASVVGCAADDGPADGWVSIGTGDTYGEWELFARFERGEWTGCLRIDPGVEECAEADGDLVTFESGDGATFGAVREGSDLEFEGDGDQVPIVGSARGFDFFVVASDAPVRVAD